MSLNSNIIEDEFFVFNLWCLGVLRSQNDLSFAIKNNDKKDEWEKVIRTNVIEHCHHHNQNSSTK